METTTDFVVMPDVVVGDILKNIPNAEDIFEAHGFVLEAMCADSLDATMEDAACIYCGFDLDEVIDDLNIALLENVPA